MSDSKPPRASTLRLKMSSIFRQFAHPVTIILFTEWKLEHRQTQSSDVKMICGEIFIVGGYKKQFIQDKGSYLWEPAAMNRMSKSFAWMLFNIPFICFPSVNLIFSQQKEKAYDQRRNDGKCGYFYYKPPLNKCYDQIISQIAESYLI